MALNFPNSPTANQVYTDTTSGNRYTWDATRNLWKWSPNTVSMSISSTAPGTPSSGQLWWNSDYGRMFVYYNDGDSSQWVDANPTPDYSSLFNPLFNALPKSATLDFGNRPVYSNSFNIADSAVTTNSKIIVTASSDNLGVSGVFAGDEMEMDQFFVTANVVTNGYITFAVVTPRYTGPIKGKRNILYTVSY